ncbi:MAG: ribosome-associated translation inhibitor RaiA [Parasporobacterium sp.]|nr:ribosome-associated translation inhibitor RaiA [Parasporobacterium sp.]
MKYIINGRNMEVSDRLREQVEKKLNKLDRFFNPNTVVHVTMSLQKDSQKIEVTIPVRGNIIRAEQSSSDMYVSIDLVEEIIERQLKRYKTKLVSRKQNAESFSSTFIEENDEPYIDDDEEGIRIVKTKHFAIKPMDPEEACLQMELLGHSFFVFFNADTNQTNVVYKRKDGTFGLIEPEA